MHYPLNPFLRALRRLDDNELKLALIGGLLYTLAGLLDVLGWRPR